MIYQPFKHIPVNRNALPYDLPYQPKNEDKKMNNINITPIIDWFKTAVPKPTIRNKNIQLGCHFEEFCEMLKAGKLTNSVVIENLEYQATLLKSCSIFIEELCYEEKQELLDSLSDQIVTAIGVAHMLGMDIQGALNEVNRSNWSKFENGKPVFNEQGKIAKGKNYFKPNLSNFINKGVL